jgi:DNA-binding MarR family transcriptional regulator
MHEIDERKFEEMRDLWRKHLHGMAGGQGTSSIEVFSLIRMIDNFFDSAMSRHPEFRDISGPRMGILIRLMVEEDSGNHKGLNPTRLSHYQNVKKNTISSLLSGLEEQGLIERTLDPQDKRGFFIRITPAGRERITATMPLRIQCVNQLTADLNASEKQQLITLLEKLRHSMHLAHHNTHQSEPEETV